ncbi:MAG: hypothetical protein OXF02_00990 [Simkaniaceae bacterium]|nr:hypothetical protein [Simkaniaceae bacterium]
MTIRLDTTVTSKSALKGFDVDAPVLPPEDVADVALKTRSLSATVLDKKCSEEAEQRGLDGRYCILRAGLSLSRQEGASSIGAERVMGGQG